MGARRIFRDMKKNQNKFWVAGASLAAFGLMGHASAGGFEKATTWSGHYNGMGGAAVSQVSGAEALYFNPAGLAAGEGQGDVSINFSPTWGQYEGPFALGTGGAIIQKKSNRSLSPVFGAVASYRVTPDLGVGAGVFVAGGSAADYGEVDFSNVGNTTFKPKVKSKLSLTEVSLGAGYRLAEGLHIGASWRYSIVGASLCEARVPSPATNPSQALAEVCLNDLSDKNAAGFRVGAQYASEAWGFGVNVRTPVKFTAEGKASVRVSTANGAPAASAAGGDGQDASITATFPLQVEVGGHFDVTPTTRVAAVYGLSKYSTNKNLVQKIATTTTTTLLDWKDQNHFRLGVESSALSSDIALRVGYVLVTGVTNEKYAKPTFSSPGTGHVMTLGAGYKLSSALEIDLAGEYSMASGKGAAPATLGDYKSNGYSLHAGVHYNF
jgi:hypothetical protein